MGISLKPEYLKRYRDIAWLLMKYGRSDLVKQAGLEGALEDESAMTATAAPQAIELSKDLEKMGPTFCKASRSFWTATQRRDSATISVKFSRSYARVSCANWIIVRKRVISSPSTETFVSSSASSCLCPLRTTAPRAC